MNTTITQPGLALRNTCLLAELVTRIDEQRNVNMPIAVWIGRCREGWRSGKSEEDWRRVVRLQVARAVEQLRRALAAAQCPMSEQEGRALAHAAAELFEKSIRGLPAVLAAIEE